FEAEARGRRVAILAIGEFLRRQDAEGIADLVAGVQLETGREVHALVLSAEAHVRLRAELQSIVEEQLARAQRRLARFAHLAIDGRIARRLQPRTYTPVVAAVFGVRLRRVADCATAQVLHPVDLALQGEIGTHAVLALHAELRHPCLVAALLAQAEAWRLPTGIRQEVESLAAMLPLHQPGIAAVVTGAAFTAGRRQFGAQLVTFGQAETRVH